MMFDKDNKDNKKNNSDDTHSLFEEEPSLFDIYDLDNKNESENIINNDSSENDFNQEKIIPKSVFRQNIKENKQKKVLNRISYKLMFKKINSKISLNKLKLFPIKFKIKEKFRFKQNSLNSRLSLKNKFFIDCLHRYLNSPMKESRIFGSILVIFGLLLIIIINFNKSIPDYILPLNSIGVEQDGSISSTIIPTSSDIYYENITLENTYKIFKIVVKGDTFGNILKHFNIKMNNRNILLISNLKKYFNVRNIFVGQKIYFYLQGGHFKGNDIRIAKVDFFINDEYSVIATWNKDLKKYNVTEYKRPLLEKKKQASGIIDSSLYQAMQKQGVGHIAISQFINLFSFDIDFQRDIRKGDNFDIGFSEFKNKQGKIIRTGMVRYAELSAQGITKRYYRFKKSNGNIDYFDEDGKSGRKALMKTPIEGARLSSTFGRRKHPVLGYTKLHKGTDFAAPKGTPIFAAGDGVVEYAGRKGSFGIYIRIRHNGSYKTVYAHMSGIAKSVRTGKRVSQGQVIGFVGSTGRSTGNHLHYEIHKNGYAVDPRKIKLSSGEKLKNKELEKFKKSIKSMLPKNI